MARVLVVGVGGIGGTVSALLLDHLSQTDGSLVAFTTNGSVVDAVEAGGGFRICGVEGPALIPGRISSVIEGGPFDWVLLAVPPNRVEEAARSALPHLAQSGGMVCFQNGLCEERVGKIVGPERVVGAIVAWGASMPEPGLFERTSSGGFTVGRPGGGCAGVDELVTLLEVIGPVTLTENLSGARWSKLAINCVISTLCTIGGDRLGRLLRLQFARRLALEAITEVVQVAHRLDVRLEKVSGTLDLDWLALTESDRVAKGSPALMAKHSLLLAVGARYRRLRSSMLFALERGRPTGVEFVTGEVVERGRLVEVPTPVNDAALSAVLQIERGELSSGVDTLRGIYDQCRSS